MLCSAKTLAMAMGKNSLKLMPDTAMPNALKALSLQPENQAHAVKFDVSMGNFSSSAGCAFCSQFIIRECQHSYQRNF